MVSEVSVEIRKLNKQSKMTKDTVCRDFIKGHCPFEGRCRFDHPDGKGGNKGKTETVCKDYARGNCSYGARCRFSHPVACKDFLQGNCKFQNCKFYHPPGAAGARAPAAKRPFVDGPEIPPEFCRDFVYAGVCHRPRCSYLHEMPNKRSRGGPGPDGPYSGGPPPSNGGPIGSGYDGPNNSYVAPELKAYVGQLELKLTMFEEKIKDLEKRCEQYEDFNRLLTERNDELKEKLDRELARGVTSSSYNSGSGGGGYSSNQGYSSSHSRNSSSRPGNYYNN